MPVCLMSLDYIVFILLMHWFQYFYIFWFLILLRRVACLLVLRLSILMNLLEIQT